MRVHAGEAGRISGRPVAEAVEQPIPAASARELGAPTTRCHLQRSFTTMSTSYLGCPTTKPGNSQVLLVLASSCVWKIVGIADGHGYYWPQQDFIQLTFLTSGR